MRKIRRIVTGHNAAGKADHSVQRSRTQRDRDQGLARPRRHGVWVTDEMTVSNDGAKDRSLRPMRGTPNAQRVLISEVVEFHRRSPGQDRCRCHLRTARQHAQAQRREFRHAPTRHKTNSIDYLVVISGSMHMRWKKARSSFMPATASSNAAPITPGSTAAASPACWRPCSSTPNPRPDRIGRRVR